MKHIYRDLIRRLFIHLLAKASNTLFFREIKVMLHETIRDDDF